MQPPHRWAKLQRHAQQIAQFAIVDAAHKGRHQHYAKPGLCTVAHGTALEIKAFSAPQASKAAFAHAVPLQVDGIKPGLAQCAGIALLARQTQTVGIDLHQPKATLPRKA